MRERAVHISSGAIVLVMLGFIYLPVVVLVIYSFQSGNLPVPPLEGFSFRWYEKAFSNERLTGSLFNSLIIGLLSAAVAAALGFLAAYSLFRHVIAGASIVRFALIAPITVSYLIIGLGLLIMFNMLGFGRSLLSVGLGHVVINLPLSFAIIYSQFGSHLRNIDNAARDLGAGDWATLTRVILPVMVPSVIAAFCLSFTLSWDEFIIALLLSRFEVTLPVMVFELMRAGMTPEVNAAGTLVFFISTVTALIAILTIAVRTRAIR